MIKDVVQLAVAIVALALLLLSIWSGATWPLIGALIGAAVVLFLEYRR